MIILCPKRNVVLKINILKVKALIFPMYFFSWTLFARGSPEPEQIHANHTVTPN